MKKHSFLRSLYHLLLASWILSLLTMSEAYAATSDWAATKGGRMRIVALPPRADGTVPAILQIEPDKGWKTYWREPGSAGIPPQVTVADGGNVTFSGLSFPVPQVFEDGKHRDYGYDRPVSLVLNLKQVSDAIPLRLDTQVFIGLCEKICVPFQASFNLVTDAKDPIVSSEAGMIAQAEMNLPESGSPDFKAEKAKLSADGKAVTVTVILPEVPKSTDSLRILLTNTDGLSFDAPADVQLTGSAMTATLRLHAAPAGYTLAGKPVQILVVSGDRAMETTLVFE